jgi:hypothetical protein
MWPPWGRRSRPPAMPAAPVDPHRASGDRRRQRRGRTPRRRRLMRPTRISSSSPSARDAPSRATKARPHESGGRTPPSISWSSTSVGRHRPPARPVSSPAADGRGRHHLAAFGATTGADCGIGRSPGRSRPSSRPERPAVGVLDRATGLESARASRTPAAHKGRETCPTSRTFGRRRRGPRHRRRPGQARPRGFGREGLIPRASRRGSSGAWGRPDPSGPRPRPPRGAPRASTSSASGPGTCSPRPGKALTRQARPA